MVRHAEPAVSANFAPVRGKIAIPITPTIKTPMPVIVVNQLLILCCTATKNDVEFTLGKLGF